MDAQSRDVVTFLLLTATVVGGMIAGAVKLILLPYLRDHLVTPVESDIPEQIEKVDKAVTALARVLDEHLSWSDRWTDLYERRTDALESELRRRRQRDKKEREQQ